MTMNWGQLKTAIQSGLENTETTFVANMEEIATRAENTIYRAVILPDGFTETSANFTASQSTVTAPSGFIRPRFMKVAVSSVNSPILLKDASFIREVYPNASTTGVPKYYSLQTTDSSFNTTIITAPTPASTYTYILGWYGVGTTIVNTSSDTQNSWLGTHAEETLLAGCILEGYIFMKGSPDMMEIYQADFSAKLAFLRGQAALGMTQDDYQPDAVLV